jgi:hypothetical protein
MGTILACAVASAVTLPLLVRASPALVAAVCDALMHGD